MTLGELLTRLYWIIGDVKDEPRFVSRDRLVSLINQGVLLFRSQIEDRFYKRDMAVTAATSTYTFPDDHLRAIRIAFEDVTLEPTSVQELQSLDDLWQTRTAEQPTRWTSQGLAFDKFRLYPTPNTSTTENYEFPTGDGRGTVGKWVSTAGVEFTFNQTTGIVVQVEGSSVAPATGTVATVDATGVGQLTIWGVEKPIALVDDNDPIPVKVGFANVPGYYALWQLYESERDHHNPILAGFYRKKTMMRLQRARLVKDNPLPFEKHVLRGWASDAYDEYEGSVPSPWPSQVDFGDGAISVKWTRRNFW